MSFTFPDPSVSQTATNPATGVQYEYKDGMWVPISLDAEQIEVDDVNQRVDAVEAVNEQQDNAIDQNEYLFGPIFNALNNTEERLRSVETLDLQSAVSALAIAKQDIIDLKAKVNALELTSFLILE